jgi:hypothetical protein
MSLRSDLSCVRQSHLRDGNRLLVHLLGNAWRVFPERDPSRSTLEMNMHRTTGRWLTTTLATLALMTFACSDDGEGKNASGPTEEDELDDLTIGEAKATLLAAGCSITGTAMTVTVKDGESAYVTLRALDSKVTVNGNVFMGMTDTGVPCEIASTGTLNILADTGGTKVKGRSVILDYVNGLYMLGAGTTPGIKVDFTLLNDTGTLNTFKVRGSAGIDLFAVGAGSGTGTAAAYALNVNAKVGSATMQAGGTGGAAVTLDTIADVTFKNIPTGVIGAGPNADVVDASGVAGTGTAFPNPIRLFGNDGADTLVGGVAADVINGGAGADTMNGCAGNDTYAMGAVSSGADVIAQACTMNDGSDTVDYSSRTGNLTVNLSKTLTAMNSGTDNLLSGESGEGAHISDKVVNVKLGAGDDTIVIPSASSVVHKVLGGPGDDAFTGGGAADLFDGEIGDDTCIGATSTMDYSARSAGVTVTLCASGCSASDKNDGNQSATGSTHTGTGAATSAAGGIDIATLTGGTGFTAASVGNTITLSDCAAVAANEDDYTIVAYVSATSVKLDVSAVSAFAMDTCDYSEALPDATTNDGAGATLGAPRTTGSVTGLNHTTHLLGHTLTLTHTADSTGGGASHDNDDGPYPVVGVISATSVAIDDTAVATFAGSVTALSWSESGAEHDDVQCALVLGGGGGDTITGDARANTLRGGVGIDTLNGGAGEDTLVGEAGADNLYGGAGDDTLIGGTGSGTDAADLLTGGDGNDVLQGDTGNDTFTCDGKNSSILTTIGASPGDSDFTVDFSSGADLGGADCDF